MSVHPFSQGNRRLGPGGATRRPVAAGQGAAQPPDPPAGASMARSWRRLRHELGLGTALLERLQKEHPGDPYAQLVGFFDHFRIASGTGRHRTVSFKTTDKYFGILRRVLHTLQALNMRNRNLGDLSLRQVRAVVRHWEQSGASPSTLTALSTVLRRFGCWIGKPQLGPPVSTLLRDPDKAVRSTSAVAPKTWESKGIHPPTAFAAMQQECHVAAIQLHLGWAFGLRVQEQLMLRPHEAHRGDRLVITRGAKGGRQREIELQEQWEYDLIEQAKAIAAAHPNRLLARGTDRTLEQARSHYYYLCRKIGLHTGGRFDSTPHGARHSFAVRRYQRSGGVPAPVVGGAMPPAAIDRAARKAVAEELGHSRVAITSAYIGSVPNLGAVARRRQARLAERELLLAGDARLQALAATAGLQAFILAGPAATGDRLTGPALVLCEAQPPVRDDLLKDILARSGELLHVPCIPIDRHVIRIGELPTFELPALAHPEGQHRRKPSPQRGQLPLDLDWPTAD